MSLHRERYKLHQELEEMFLFHEPENTFSVRIFSRLNRYCCQVFCLSLRIVITCTVWQFYQINFDDNDDEDDDEILSFQWNGKKNICLFLSETDWDECKLDSVSFSLENECSFHGCKWDFLIKNWLWMTRGLSAYLVVFRPVEEYTSRTIIHFAKHIFMCAGV